MKLILCILFAVTAAFATADADLTIVQKIEGGGPVSQLTMKIKGKKVRVEAGPQMSTIVDTETGNVVNIMPAQKMVMRVSAEQAKAAAAMAGGGALDGAAKEKVNVTPTGKKETINGYETEEYVASTPKFKASYWIAKNYPNAEEIMKQLQATSSQALNSSAVGMPDFRDFPGLPLRTNVTMEGQQFVSTISSVNMDPIPESEFKVPEDYREVPVPSLGGIQPAGKPAATPRK